MVSVHGLNFSVNRFSTESLETDEGDTNLAQSVENRRTQCEKGDSRPIKIVLELLSRALRVNVEKFFTSLFLVFKTLPDARYEVRNLPSEFGVRCKLLIEVVLRVPETSRR